MSLIGAIWGIGSIVLVFAVAIYRLASRAAQIFSYDLEWYHWAALVISVVLTAYAEGYRGLSEALFSSRAQGGTCQDLSAIIPHSCAWRRRRSSASAISRPRGDA